MQPENSLHTTPGIEQAQAAPRVGPEVVPNLPPVISGVERGQEQVEQAAEAGARIADVSAQAAAAAGTAAQPATPQNPTTGQAMSATPLVAADEDVIEKEWVDKAKEIIEQTKDDPHQRTQKVNELQREYLNKRYGKVVGAGE